MTNTYGTIAELKLKPGDVVGFDAEAPEWTMMEDGRLQSESVFIHDSYFAGGSRCDVTGFFIISRASTEPPRWCDMTDAEKAVVLLAWQRGEIIERWFWKAKMWFQTVNSPIGFYLSAYRARPAPVLAETTIGIRSDDSHAPTHNLTFPTSDGVPVTGTYTSDAGDVIVVGDL
jgi:hypothetical protein